MAVSSLFDSALQVVLSEVTHYERGFPYLPGNVRTRLARVMAKHGLLHRGNMPLVGRTSSSTLQPSSIILWLCCHSSLPQQPSTFHHCPSSSITSCVCSSPPFPTSFSYSLYTCTCTCAVSYSAFLTVLVQPIFSHILFTIVSLTVCHASYSGTVMSDPPLHLCHISLSLPPPSLPLSLSLFLPPSPSLPATRCSMMVSWTWISVSVC